MALDHNLMAAALEGLEAQRSRILVQIATVRQLLGASPAGQSLGDVTPKQRKKRKPLSAEVKKRMAASQRKRWSKVKKQKA